MKENGFTLSELIVVIVIIGVLAALAMPKFNAAIGKAKSSEVPLTMAEIGKSEFMYHQETNTYIDVPYANWHENLSEILGVDIEVGLFSYYVSGSTRSTFTAHAKVEVLFGGIPNTTVEANMNERDQVSFINDNGTLESYLRAWADQ